MGLEAAKALAAYSSGGKSNFRVASNPEFWCAKAQRLEISFIPTVSWSGSRNCNPAAADLREIYRHDLLKNANFIARCTKALALSQHEVAFLVTTINSAEL